MTRPVTCTCGRCEKCRKREYKNDWRNRPGNPEKIKANRHRNYPPLRLRIEALRNAALAADAELEGLGIARLHPTRMQLRAAIRTAERPERAT
jgi:hypothetical protein